MKPLVSQLYGSGNKPNVIPTNVAWQRQKEIV